MRTANKNQEVDQEVLDKVEGVKAFAAKMADMLQERGSPNEAVAILIAAMAEVLDRLNDKDSLEMADVVAKFGAAYRTSNRFHKQ